MYPQSIDKFSKKLNKIDGNTYVIEEEVTIKDGIYEDELEHDNVSNSSIRVYTGSKLTGNKIENFILSTPSKTPWKRWIKVFSNASKGYVTYETQGDIVEADDINKLQDSVVNTQEEVDRYKISNDIEVKSLKDRYILLENNKSEKTYVDTELNKRYLKEQVFTKDEVLQKIKDVVGASPSALDTLQEIAKALNNDADFAGTMTKQLSNKVDKVPGKQLSSEDYSSSEKSKLAAIESNANNYIHPTTHNADIITGLSKVAKSNNYSDLDNKPAIPTKVSQLENDKKFITKEDIDTSQNHVHTNIAAIAKITDEKVANWDNVSIALNGVFEVVNIPGSNGKWGFTLGKIDATATKRIVNIKLCGSNDYDADEKTHGIYEIMIKTHSQNSANNMNCTAELIALREPEKLSANGIKNVYIRKSDNVLVVETNGNMSYANYIAIIAKDSKTTFSTNVTYLDAPSDLSTAYVTSQKIKSCGMLTWNDLKGVQ